MKKVLCAFVLAAVLLVMMAACNSGTTNSSKATESSKSQSVSSEAPKADSSTPISAPDISSAASTESSEAESSEYYFKDNVLVSEDVKIEITDYKVIEPGEEGNEYGEKPVIAFWYNTTNLSGDDINPMMAWISMFDAIQDNDPNMVNELSTGMLPDDQFLDTQMNTIKKDGTVANAMSYELSDTTTPVTLKAHRGIVGEELGTQVFELK